MNITTFVAGEFVTVIGVHDHNAIATLFGAREFAWFNFAVGLFFFHGLAF